MKSLSNINILINGFGLTDSGAITVFEKLLNELSAISSIKCNIVCYGGGNLDFLISKYSTNNNVNFIVTLNRSLFYRFYYENFIFRKIIRNKSIQLLYNFSGTYQFFIKIPQLVKVQNLLCYSKNLDLTYQRKNLFFVWSKQVFLKRLIFTFMLSKSKHIDIQSSHVKSSLLDFIDEGEKAFYVKSDIDISDGEFQAPKQYDFSKKIKFLYIVGPHFEVVHKNLKDFTNVMLDFNDQNIDFDINITLTHKQLNDSKVWDASLNSKTNFLGYMDNKEKVAELFCNNTILISTSVVETLGLHVIEGIKNGIVTIVPDEEYANEVYGEKVFKYELFNKDSLMNTTMRVINYIEPYDEMILSIQDDLRLSEMAKFSSIEDVFNEVINV